MIAENKLETVTMAEVGQRQWRTSGGPMQSEDVTQVIGLVIVWLLIVCGMMFLG